jgi:hypothetical protein
LLSKKKRSPGRLGQFPGRTAARTARTNHVGSPQKFQGSSSRHNDDRRAFWTTEKACNQTPKRPSLEDYRETTGAFPRDVRARNWSPSTKEREAGVNKGSKKSASNPGQARRPAVPCAPPPCPARRSRHTGVHERGAEQHRGGLGFEECGGCRSARKDSSCLPPALTLRPNALAAAAFRAPSFLINYSTMHSQSQERNKRVATTLWLWGPCLQRAGPACQVAGQAGGGWRGARRGSCLELKNRKGILSPPKETFYLRSECINRRQCALACFLSHSLATTRGWNFPPISDLLKIFR